MNEDKNPSSCFVSPDIISLNDKYLDIIFRRIKEALEKGDQKEYERWKGTLDSHAKEEYQIG